MEIISNISNYLVGYINSRVHLYGVVIILLTNLETVQCCLQADPIFFLGHVQYIQKPEVNFNTTAWNCYSCVTMTSGQSIQVNTTLKSCITAPNLTFEIRCDICVFAELSINNKQLDSRSNTISNFSAEENTVYNIRATWIIKDGLGGNDLLKTHDVLVKLRNGSKVISNHTLVILKISACRLSKYLTPLYILPSIIYADAQNIIQYSVNWTNPSLTQSQYYYDLILQIPSIMKVEYVSCSSPSTSKKEIKSQFLMFNVNGTNAGNLGCVFSGIVENYILPGANYNLYIILKYTDVSAGSCSQIVRNASVIVIPQLTVLLKHSSDTLSLMAGDELDVTLNFKIPQCAFHLNISVTLQDKNNNAISSKDSPFTFLSANNTFLSFGTLIAKIIPGTLIKDGVNFDYGLLKTAYTPVISYEYFNFTFTLTICSDPLRVAGRKGNVVINTGVSSFTLPYEIVGPQLKPYLLVTKQSEVAGEDGTLVKVNIVVWHSEASVNDAYSIEVEDAVHGMDVVGIQVWPRVNSSLKYVDSLTALNIIGYISYLKLGSTATIAYEAKFIRNTLITVSNSSVEVYWSNGQKNGPSFGPVYSNKSCIQKILKDKNKFLPKYGYIILAILMGLVCGCLAAALLLCCCRRYSGAKQYILHTNEVSDINSNEIASPVAPSMPVYHSISGNPAISKPAEENIFRRLASNLKRNHPDTSNADIGESLGELLWKTLLLKGDVKAASDVISKSYADDQLSLLQFTLKLWFYIWRSTLAIYVDKLVADGEISSDTQKEGYGVLVNLFEQKQPFAFGKCIENLEALVDKGSTAILKSYNDGLNFYRDILKNLKIKSIPSEARKSNDPDVLKITEKKEKIAEEKLRAQLSLKNDARLDDLRESFTNTFDKFLDTIYHISFKSIEEHLHKVADGFSLIICSKSISFIHLWIKATVLKETDSLKRKRHLPNHLDSEFQKIFSEELEQVVNHLESEKIKIVERDESQTLTSYLDQRKILENDMLETFDVLWSKLNSSTLAEYKGETMEEIMQTMMKSIEYADSCQEIHCRKNSATDNGLHGVYDVLNQSFRIFFSRMKTHVEDLCNKEVDAYHLVTEFGSYIGEHIQMNEITVRTRLSAIFLHLEDTFEKIMVKLKDFTNENAGLFEEYESSFRELQDSLLLSRKSEMPQVMKTEKISFKSAIYCQSPLSWEDCVEWVENAPKYCIATLFERFISFGVFSDYKFSNEIEKICQSKKLEMFNSSILGKFDLMNDGIHKRLKHLHCKSKEYLQSVMKNDNGINSTQELQHNSYLMLFHRLKRLAVYEKVLNATANFLISILSNMNGSTQANDEDFINSVNSFSKKLKKIFKSHYPAVTEDSDLKAEILAKVDEYISVCDVLVPPVDDELMSIMNFNKHEITNHLFEIGKQHKHSEDRLSLLKDLTHEIWKYIGDLMQRKVISIIQVYKHLRDLSLCLDNEDFDTACKTIFGDEHNTSLAEIIKYESEDVEGKTEEEPDGRKKLEDVKGKIAEEPDGRKKFEFEGVKEKTED